MHHGMHPNDKNRYCVRGPPGRNSATQQDAGHGLRDLLPVRAMTRTRRCGPLLKIEHKNAATLAISTENRKQVHDELALTVHAVYAWPKASERVGNASMSPLLIADDWARHMCGQQVRGSSSCHSKCTMSWHLQFTRCTLG